MSIFVKTPVTPLPQVADLRPSTEVELNAPVDLDLSSNEGPVPPGGLLWSLIDADIAVLRSYPDPSALKKIISERLNVVSDRLLITSGGEDAIERVCRAYLGPGRALVVPSPSDELLSRHAKICGARVVDVPWPDGPCPVEAIVGSVTSTTSVIAIASPNNPTGLVATGEDLQRISRAAPNALVVVDLSYGEFAEEDLLPVAVALPNAVVIKTFSKAWGLAGLRTGFAMAPQDVIETLHLVGSPNAVAAPSLLLAQRALEDMETGSAVMDYAAQVKAERRDLEQFVTSVGARPVNGQGNFLLMHLDDRDWWRDGLAGFGIRVRTFSDAPHLADALRVTCPGDAEAYDRLTHAVASLTVPQALLIDLKSVVVSDGPSRCEAIVDTAAEFAVKVTPQDVYTRLHDVDDDCVLIHDLLKSAGAEALPDEIRERLNAVRNQTSNAPLLGREESELVDRQLLQRLSGRIPMVLISDEPRREVGQWLRMRHLDQFFRALICKEDAPPAPSYEALRLGCEAIGATRAWWIAGSASAMSPARVVGLLPLGVLFPGRDTVAARSEFIEAGAARVLADLHEVERRLVFHAEGSVSQPGE